MQSFTVADCGAMAINEITTRVDIRNNKIYNIIKLKMSSDGSNDRCWMQENLKIAGVTLTPTDSNVASNFVLPAVATSSPTSSHDVIRPVYRDISPYNADPYGYLYNWATAIAYSVDQYGASANNDSRDVTGTAQYSICPKGWRLPFGSADNTNEFALVDIYSYGGTGNNRSGDTTILDEWLAPSGFAAVYGGYGFNNQGVNAYFWSSTTYPPQPSAPSFIGAYRFFLGYTGVIYTQDATSKTVTFSVRCIFGS
jgi:uncharacterized protein (TIGR02145 family)